MIDARFETVLSLSDAANHVERIAGKRVTRSSLYRWASDGIDGIRLETRCVGGRRITSEQAIQRFIDAITEAKSKK